MDEMLNLCFQLESDGKVEQALDGLNLLIREFEGGDSILIFEYAKMQFRNQKYLDALLSFIEYIKESDDAKALELVLEAYYEPNQEKYQLTLETNISRLRENPRCYATTDEFTCKSTKVVWEGETLLIVWHDGCFYTYQTYEISAANEEKYNPIALVNPLGQVQMIECARNLKELTLPKAKVPLYLFYTEPLWNGIMQVYDLEAMGQMPNIVMLCGKEQIQNFFTDYQAYRPDKIKGYNLSGYNDILEESYKQLVVRKEETKRLITVQYPTVKEVNSHIQMGVPKILFVTSQFTTALQYHTRDMCDAANKMGFCTKVLKEKSIIHRYADWECMRIVQAFQPDIIFLINNFRFHLENPPNSVIVVTWIQDPMEQVMDRSTPNKLGKRDIVLNHMYKNTEIVNMGYKNMISAPIPANQELYKLNNQMQAYTYDICLVCHASSRARGVEIALDIAFEMGLLLEWVDDFLLCYWERVKDGGIIYSSKLFYLFMKDYITEYKISIDAILLEAYAEKIFSDINQRFFRHAIVEWLLEAGFTNIQLWGSEWSRTEEFGPYAKGIAENGDALAKIYQSSRIVLGNNCFTTGAARVWESMLSGAFYMSNYIPVEYDQVDVRDVLKEDEEIVMFRNREDLIEKVAYYLNQEEARQAMIEKGREKALKERTYEGLMGKLWKEIQRRSEE